jgi:hypothetical protein
MDIQVRQVIQKLEHLSPEKLAEVEDFIDFLRQKSAESLLRKDFAQGAEGSFHRVWDNDEDAVYDKL